MPPGPSTRAPAWVSDTRGRCLRVLAAERPEPGSEAGLLGRGSVLPAARPLWPSPLGRLHPPGRVPVSPRPLPRPRPPLRTHFLSSLSPASGTKGKRPCVPGPTRRLRIPTWSHPQRPASKQSHPQAWAPGWVSLTFRGEKGSARNADSCAVSPVTRLQRLVFVIFSRRAVLRPSDKIPRSGGMICTCTCG